LAALGQALAPRNADDGCRLRGLRATSAERGDVSDATIKNHAAFIWSVADRLRGDYKQSEYGKVILPLTVRRRLDCVLEPTKAAVLEQARRH
jgi:HsdM N-terminal domain